MNTLSPEARNFIDTLFATRILALEEENNPGVFAKQMQLKDLKKEINSWINQYPKGAFHIQMENEEGSVTIVTVTNCHKDDVKYEYIIDINNDWTGFTGEQLTDSKKHKIVLKIIEI